MFTEGVPGLLGSPWCVTYAYDIFKYKVKEKVKKLYNLDICHGDLWLGNIVIKEDPFDVFFIDWDTSLMLLSCLTRLDYDILNWEYIYIIVLHIF